MSSIEKGEPLPSTPQETPQSSVEVRQLFAVIGELEVMRQIMTADIAALQEENAELRAQLERAGK